MTETKSEPIHPKPSDQADTLPPSSSHSEEADRAAQLPPQPLSAPWSEMGRIQVQFRHTGPERRKPVQPTPTEREAFRLDELGIPSDLPPSSVPVRDSALFTEGEFVTDISRLTDPSALIETGGVRDRAILIRMDGAEAGEVFSLDQGAVRVGRHPMTEFTVRDDGLSRVHARIHSQDGLWCVEDQGSTNGTFVQGRRVLQSVLHDGDTLQFGPRVTFRYSLVDARQEAVLRELYESSKLDALTGVFNRKHFEERLESDLAAAERRQFPLSLLMFDLDHFKQVNDRFGHPAGDAVLQHVAALVKQRLRASDLLARVGGEEFAVILRGADLRTAVRIAERMRVSVATKPAFFAGQQIPVSISVGCVSADCCEEATLTSLMAMVDRRLYVAKNAGRNRVVASE